MDDLESIKAYHERVRREIQKKLDRFAESLSARERRSRQEPAEWERSHARMERLLRNAKRLGRKWQEEDQISRECLADAGD